MAVQQNEMVQGGYMTVGGAPEVICTGQVLEMLTQNWKRSSVRHIHEKRSLNGDACESIFHNWQEPFSFVRLNAFPP